MNYTPEYDGPSITSSLLLQWIQHDKIQAEATMMSSSIAAAQPPVDSEPQLQLDLETLQSVPVSSTDPADLVEKGFAPLLSSSLHLISLSNIY